MPLKNKSLFFISKNLIMREFSLFYYMYIHAYIYIYIYKKNIYIYKTFYITSCNKNITDRFKYNIYREKNFNFVTIISYCDIDSDDEFFRNMYICI